MRMTRMTFNQFTCWCQLLKVQGCSEMWAVRMYFSRSLSSFSRRVSRSLVIWSAVTSTKDFVPINFPPKPAATILGAFLLNPAARALSEVKSTASKLSDDILDMARVLREISNRKLALGAYIYVRLYRTGEAKKKKLGPRLSRRYNATTDTIARIFLGKLLARATRRQTPFRRATITLVMRKSPLGLLVLAYCHSPRGTVYPVSTGRKRKGRTKLLGSLCARQIVSRVYRPI